MRSPETAAGLLGEACRLFEGVLGRPIDEAAKAGLAHRVTSREYDALALVVELIGSSEFMSRLLAHAISAHLGLINHARQIMVRRLLPPAPRIIDLGGINSPLVDMGYPHAFTRMVMVDLDAGERHPMYQGATFGTRESPAISAHSGDMTRLDAFADASFDLAWSGQSIEHVDAESGARMCREVHRILAPGGFFCLDTPNRGITSIHTRDVGGGFVHPEHRYEYTVSELRELLMETGFEIVDARGICEMPATRASGVFRYDDFVLGNPIVADPEDGYIMYFAARKTQH